jgi:hypothetical protein
MKSLSECIDQELQWVHPHLLKSEYELRAGDELLARIYSKGVFSSQVFVETADGHWMIERKGLRQTMRVLLPDTDKELATIKCQGSDQATLVFPDGREYRWQRTSFWHDDWTWLNNEGTSLLHVKSGVHILLEPAAQGLPELALLITLGWYLHKQQEKEAATIAATVPTVMS